MEGKNDKSPQKHGISFPSFGFPSALPFPTPSLSLPAFAFYYSSEVIVLKARGMRYISLYKSNFKYLRFSQEWLLFLSSLEALPEEAYKNPLNGSGE